MLPFYLLHEPVIVAAARFIVRWQIPLRGKYALLVVVSFAVTLGLYELLIRRFRSPRVLFGMQGQPSPAGRPRDLPAGVPHAPPSGDAG